MDALEEVGVPQAWVEASVLSGIKHKSNKDDLEKTCCHTSIAGTDHEVADKVIRSGQHHIWM